MGVFRAPVDVSCGFLDGRTAIQSFGAAKPQNDLPWKASKPSPGRILPNRKNASRRGAAAIFGRKPTTRSQNAMRRQQQSETKLQQKLSSRSSFGLRKAKLRSKLCPTPRLKRPASQKGASRRSETLTFYTCMKISMANLRRDFLLGRGGSKCKLPKFKTMRR